MRMLCTIAGGYTFALAFLYVLAMVFLIRPIVHFAYRKFQERGEAADSSLFSSMLFLMVILSAFTSEVIGTSLIQRHASHGVCH